MKNRARHFATKFSFPCLMFLAATIAVPVMSSTALAAIDSSVSGTAVDADGVAVSNAKVELLGSDGHLVKQTTTSLTGAFEFFPVEFGNYQVHLAASGFTDYRSSFSVRSAQATQLDVHLTPATDKKEYVINVKEKRNLIQTGSSGSKTSIDKERIETLPGGGDISLPQLLSTTTPGIVQGPFGQMFIRGNHANIQYQIDGVQLPESPSGTFGDAFSPRNIDHMEIITGGVPAEYGERTAAVVNIITKSGPETAQGSAELRYGSYNTETAQANYGGSDSSGKFRYFLNGQFTKTDRGLDTPQPASYTDQAHGGKDAVHDQANWNDQFVRLDYIANDANKFSLNLFNSGRFYQIPNYPSSFSPTDPFFQADYVDNFGNAPPNPGQPTYIWTPPNTGDTQNEQNSYAEFVWKHTFNEHSYLQIAPYYKRSRIVVGNDPTDDLAAFQTTITNPQNTSFAMDRTTNNYGLKSDYTQRLNDENLFKAGFQAQQSSTNGGFSIQTALATPASNFVANDTGYLEAIYAQDSWTIFKPLILTAGLRYSATQFNSDQLTTQDGLLQPRIGLDFMATESTKLHAFYGKLFQPAPFENLHDAFTGAGGGQPSPYDIKAEKDDYYEVGVAQQFGQAQLVTVNTYYKNAVNMLDDTQLLNTSIGQPYNFANGYASGIEFSYNLEVTPNWSGFFNYSYEDARGRGISGGFFAFPVGTPSGGDYQFLDHVQLDTSNAGATYKTDKYWATLQGLYGSGLRTGANNSLSLPSHLTFDATAGYIFGGANFWSKWRVSADVTNIADNPYPITVNNGFNGSHYAAGRQYFLRLTKEL